MTEAGRAKRLRDARGKRKAPYVPGSTHGAGIVPDDGGRPKCAQLWHRVYFLRPIRPMERPYIGHRRISRMNLSALCALLVRHSILFCKVHYRSGFSLVAVMPFALFPVDGYILLISPLFYEDRKWPLNGPEITYIFALCGCEQGLPPPDFTRNRLISLHNSPYPLIQTPKRQKRRGQKVAPWRKNNFINFL